MSSDRRVRVPVMSAWLAAVGLGTGAITVGSNAFAAGDPATRATTQPAHAPLVLADPVGDKLFVLLSIVDRRPNARAAVTNDADLGRLASGKRQALARATAGPLVAAADVSGPMRWTPAEVAAVDAALRRVFDAHPALRADVAADLRAGGTYVRQANLSDDDLIAHAWAAEAAAMNHVGAVYADGERPAYPAIDSVTGDVKAADFLARLGRAAAAAAAAPAEGGEAFYAVPVRFAVAVLKLNHRDEAGRFEPMADGENRATIARLRGVDWSGFPYAAVLLPGIGPDNTTDALSPGGRANCALGADRFRAGKAPVVIVSGGYVHPNQTPYCEAVEMRRALIDEFHVPADAILIDPHARHTTTNLRNATRLIYRYGLPMDKPVLIASNGRQVDVIVSRGFARRCDRELGYQPMRIGERLSPTDLAAWPRIDSLQGDPVAPLDP